MTPRFALYSRVKRAAALATLMTLTACTQAPDFTAVQAERAKPVLRTDMFQSAASNGRVLVAGTANGVLVTSTDGGSHWTRHRLASPASIVSITACPDGSFAALDFYRKVWIAAPDGAAWTARAINTPDNLTHVACDPGNGLWVVGSRSRILFSADKGASWESRHSGDDSILTTLQFVDAKRGHVLGEFGTHLATHDGGHTWVKQSALPDDFYPYAAVFRDDGKAWTSGLAGVLLRTEDGGRSWSRLPNPAAAPMYAMTATDRTVYAFGVGGKGLVLGADGQWASLEHGKAMPAYIAAAAAHGDDSLLVVGASGYLHVFKPVAVPANGRSQ